MKIDDVFNLVPELKDFNEVLVKLGYEHLVITNKMKQNEIFNKYSVLGDIKFLDNKYELYKKYANVKKINKDLFGLVYNICKEYIDIDKQDLKDEYQIIFDEIVSIIKNKEKSDFPKVLYFYYYTLSKQLLEDSIDSFTLDTAYDTFDKLQDELKESVLHSMSEMIDEFNEYFLETEQLSESKEETEEDDEDNIIEDSNEIADYNLDMDSYDYPAIAYFNNLQFAPNIIDPIEMPEIERGVIEYKLLLRKALKDELPIELEFDNGEILELDTYNIKFLLDIDNLVMYRAMNAFSLNDFVQQLSVHVPFYKSILQQIDDKNDDIEELDETADFCIDTLNNLAENKLYAFISSIVENQDLAINAVVDTANPITMHRKTLGGKIDIVNRVRNGKVEMHKRVSNTKGYRIKDGKIIKMSFGEKKKRKIGARVASRKRRINMSKILKKRDRSMTLRKRRLGD